MRFTTQDGQPFAPMADITSADGDVGPFLVAKRFAEDFLAARPDDGVVFVPGAVGGTSFWNQRWNPGDDLYGNLVALTRRVVAANPTWRLRALLFQGFETDAKNAMPATVFRTALTHFVESIRADLQAMQLPIVFGELPPGFADAREDRMAIRDEVARAASRLAYTAVASSRVPSVAHDDGLHYSTEGLLTVGDRYAAALAIADANSLAELPADARRSGSLGGSTLSLRSRLRRRRGGLQSMSASSTNSARSASTTSTSACSSSAPRFRASA